MVNQWGRDSNLSSSGSRSSGGAGVVIAAVVALVIGIGGGYGAGRFLSGASADDIAARDRTIAELQQRISSARSQADGAQASDTVLRAEIETLQQQVAALKKANDTLKKSADEQPDAANPDAQAEIDALRKTIEQAGDLQGQLSRARRSLKVSELQIIELEGAVKARQDEIGRLRADLAKAATQGNSGNKALSEQVEKLQSALDAARQQASGVPDLKKRIARLEDEVAQKTADASGVQQKLGTLEKQAEDLKGKLAEAEERLAGKETEVAALKAQTEELRKAVSAAESRATAIDGQRILTGMTVNSLRAEKEKLETENAGLRQTIANLQAARTNRSNDDDTAQAPDESRDEGRRDAAAVREALANMPGFGRMAPDKQTELAERLENGECVVAALKATLGRVPAIALRNLIQDLGRKC